MAWLTVAATYFLLWWTVLFAVMPFRLRTQDEVEEVTLGTVRSAPFGPHVMRAILWTTLVTTFLYLGGYALIVYFQLSFDDLPKIIPQP